MFHYLVRLFGRFLLFLLGWQPCDVTEGNMSKLYNEDRIVIVYPHTSYWDFALYVCYYLSMYPGLCNIQALTNSGDMEKWYGNMLRFIGCIEGSRLEDHNMGTTDRIINHLKAKKTFRFTISPEGTMQKSPWRSGYFYIAKGLNCKIVVAGQDYHKRKIVVGNLYEPIDKDFVEKQLKKEMTEITPCYQNRVYLEYDNGELLEMK